MDVCMDVWMDRCMDGCMYECLYGCTDGWMDVWMDVHIVSKYQVQHWDQYSNVARKTSPKCQKIVRTRIVHTSGTCLENV